MKKICKVLVLLLVMVLFITGCNRIGITSSNKAEQGKLYENKKLGFTLELPANWEGNYIIHEYDDSIEVCFIGQSETSKELYEDSSEVHGLSMFWIGTESCVSDSEFLDSVYEIGESKGVKYYHFTGTDYPVGSLMSEYIEGEKEKQLAANDLIKAKEMEKDKDSILRTFKGK